MLPAWSDRSILSVNLGGFRGVVEDRTNFIGLGNAPGLDVPGPPCCESLMIEASLPARLLDLLSRMLSALASRSAGRRVNIAAGSEVVSVMIRNCGTMGDAG